jgi:hypothetical protein
MKKNSASFVFNLFFSNVSTYVSFVLEKLVLEKLVLENYVFKFIKKKFFRKISSVQHIEDIKEKFMFVTADGV